MSDYEHKCSTEFISNWHPCLVFPGQMISEQISVVWRKNLCSGEPQRHEESKDKKDFLKSVEENLFNLFLWRTNLRR